MTLSIENIRAVYEDCGSNLAETAERLGVPYSTFALQWGPSLAPAPRTLARHRRTPPDNLGQEWCRKHTIAIKHCQNPYWPKASDLKIEDARNKYEAGTHEMLTARDGDWFILYCVPRTTRCGARRFFQVI